MSPAHEIANYLANQGVGIFPGTSSAAWSINVSTEPEVPDTTITLQDEGGGEPDTDDLDIQTSVVAIRVRSDRSGGYLAAYAKQEEIRQLLILPAPLLTANMRFIGLRMTGNIANLGRDDNDRHLLLATYEAQRQG